MEEIEEPLSEEERHREEQRAVSEAGGGEPEEYAGGEYGEADHERSSEEADEEE